MKRMIELGMVAIATLVFAVPATAMADTAKDPALQKIVSDFEQTYGPIYSFWSDRNQLRMAAALIEQAQKDGKITSAEGQAIEDVKQELGLISPGADLIQAAQESWLGHICSFDAKDCTKSSTYKIAQKYVIKYE